MRSIKKHVQSKKHQNDESTNDSCSDEYERIKYDKRDFDQTKVKKSKRKTKRKYETDSRDYNVITSNIIELQFTTSFMVFLAGGFCVIISIYKS